MVEPLSTLLSVAVLYTIAELGNVKTVDREIQAGKRWNDLPKIYKLPITKVAMKIKYRGPENKELWI